MVSIETQTLLVCKKDTIVERYDCSTSRFGNGNRENSFKTPLGAHRIKEKIRVRRASRAAFSKTAGIRASIGIRVRPKTI